MSSNPAPVNQEPWWKGTRGEWLVIAQAVLMCLVFLGPRTLFGHPSWQFPFPQECRVVGGVMALLGAGLFVAGLVGLGSALTPLPYPKDGAKLVQTGPYALVRHPIYSGGLFLAFGWALAVHGWLTLGYAAALFVLLDVKSRREEKWLMGKFPEYAAYRQRVCRLIPFIY